MVVFPGSKINIGLNVISKRDDSYHNLQSIFYPIGLSDILEIIPSSEASFEQTGTKLNVDKESNLVYKAEALMREKFNLPDHKIHLHKIVPDGAGLGGGSADASAVLVALNKIHKLGLSEKELEVISEELGSDCPFFIKNAPAYVSGRGEILQEVSNQLNDVFIKVIKPSVKIPTSVAFAGIMPRENGSDFLETYNGDKSNWQTEFYNDFEDALNDESLVCLEIKNKLIEEGAFYASMTGSGSAVYGLFHEEPSSKQDQHFEWIGRLN